MHRCDTATPHRVTLDSAQPSRSGRAIFASTEKGVATFCLPGAACGGGGGHAAAAAPAMLELLDNARHGCIVLTVSPAGDRVFCAVQSAGVAVYDTSGGREFAPAFLGFFTQQGLPVREYAPPALVSGLGGGGPVWLYAMFSPKQLSVFDVSAPSPDAYVLLATTPVAVANATDGFAFGSAVLVTPNHGIAVGPGATLMLCYAMLR